VRAVEQIKATKEKEKGEMHIEGEERCAGKNTGRGKQEKKRIKKSNFEG
jgi:hypothetical protein